jgi:hypothetical protein
MFVRAVLLFKFLAIIVLFDQMDELVWFANSCSWQSPAFSFCTELAKGEAAIFLVPISSFVWNRTDRVRDMAIVKVERPGLRRNFACGVQFRCAHDVERKCTIRGKLDEERKKTIEKRYSDCGRRFRNVRRSHPKSRSGRRSIVTAS